MLAKLEDSCMDDNESPSMGIGKKDSGNKTRRRRQERLTEINRLIKQKSYSPDNSILANIKELDK